MTMQEDGKNYGDFLLDTVEAAKEQFTDKEYAWLKESATELSLIHICSGSDLLLLQHLSEIWCESL